MFEEYLDMNKKPIIAMETLLDMIIVNADDEGIFSGKYERKKAERHVSLLFALGLIIKHMRKQRNVYYRMMKYEKYNI